MNLKTAWLKSYVRYPVDIRSAKRHLARAAEVRGTGGPGRPIVVDLHTPQLLFDCGRHLNCIAEHASAAGSPFVLRCSKLLLAAVARKLYGPELLSSPNVSWCEKFSDCPDSPLVLTDSSELTQATGAVAMMIGRDIQAGSIVMPYPMHHRTLQQLPASNLSQLQQHGRAAGRGGLFFAGRLKDNYKRSKIESRFGVVNRLNVIDTLRQGFADRIIHTPAVGGTTDHLSGIDGRASITLVDSEGVTIESSEWLSTLARYDFFICSPGVCQPMCHNVIEAMSVGTIPLIEYGDRFSPPLIDSVNALVFRGTDGLAAAVRRIDAMTPGEVSTLRRGAAEYFNRHLCGDKFLSAIRDLPASRRPRAISMPFHDRNLYQRDADEAKPIKSPAAAA